MIGILYFIYDESVSTSKLSLKRAKDMTERGFRDALVSYGISRDILDTLCNARSNSNMDLYYTRVPRNLSKATRFYPGMSKSLQSDITYLLYDTRIPVEQIYDYYAGEFSGMPPSSSSSNTIKLSYLMSDNDETFKILSRSLPDNTLEVGTLVPAEGLIAINSAVEIEADELYLDAKHERMLANAAFRIAEKYLDFSRLDSLKITREYNWTRYYAQDNKLWVFKISVVYDDTRAGRVIQIPEPELTDDRKVQKEIEDVFDSLAEELKSKNYQRTNQRRI